MKKIYILIFILIFSIPLLQRKFNFIKKVSIHGKPLYSKKPKLDYKSFVSGDYQKQYERFILERSGLYGLLFRLNNTLNYNFFDLAEGTYDNLYLGKGGTIFEKMHMEDYNGLLDIKSPIVVKLTKIKKLQDYLAKQNKKFLVVIHPNKYYDDPTLQSPIFTVNNPKVRKISLIQPMLDKFGINYIRLSEELDNSKHFPESGAHLKYLSKCKAVKLIINKFNKIYGKTFPEMDCIITGNTWKYQGEELDLLNLINVFINKKSVREVESFAVKSNEEFIPQKLLIVGTSFSFGIKTYLAKAKIIDTTNLLFYSKLLFKYKKMLSKKPAQRQIPQTAQMHTLENLNSHDIVIFEITEHRIDELGYKFIENLPL